MVYFQDENTVLRSAEAKDVDEVLTLANERFGDGYADRDTFFKWLEIPELFILAEVSGKVVAYLVSIELEADTIAKKMKLPFDYVEGLSGGRMVMQAKSAAIYKEYERLGLMHKMFKIMLDNAEKRGYKLCLASAWKYNGKIPIGKVFDYYGFEKIAEKENLWYEISGYKCLVCGGRCKCTAVIYQYIF